MNSLHSPGPGAEGDPRRLRADAFGLLMTLLVQFALGIVVNLYVHVPAGRTGYGGAALFLVLHGLIGLALVAGSMSLAVRAVTRRARQITAPAVMAAAVLLAAAVNGMTFLGTGSSGYSLAMALCTAIAIGCYGLILYRAPDTGHQASGG